MAADWCNLDWISSNLAVGGCFPCGETGAIVRHHDLAAIVDVRLEACDDEAELSRHGVAFLHLPTEDMCGVDQQKLCDGVRFVSNHLARGDRVLIHCHHGIGRSALLALCVLVAEGADPLAALELAKARRSCVSLSQSQFAAWSAWLAAFAQANTVTWAVPDFKSFAAISYRNMGAQA